MSEQEYLDLKKSITVGEELSFYYKGNEYWFSHTPDGKCHFTRSNDSYTQTFNNVHELFNNAKINGQYLKMIYPNIEW